MDESNLSAALTLPYPYPSHGGTWRLHSPPCVLLRPRSSRRRASTKCPRHLSRDGVDLDKEPGGGWEAGYLIPGGSHGLGVSS